MTTSFFRGRDGFQGLSVFKLDDFGLNGMALRVETYKTSTGTLTTAANAVTLTEHGFSMVMYQDYGVILNRTKTRVTEKAVTTQHNASLVNIDKVISDIVAFYAKANAKHA